MITSLWERLAELNGFVNKKPPYYHEINVDLPIHIQAQLADIADRRKVEFNDVLTEAIECGLKIMDRREK